MKRMELSVYVENKIASIFIVVTDIIICMRRMNRFHSGQGKTRDSLVYLKMVLNWHLKTQCSLRDLILIFTSHRHFLQAFTTYR